MQRVSTGRLQDERVNFGAGGLAPLGVRIPPPIKCPERTTSSGAGRKGPQAWESLFSARTMVALKEVSNALAN